MAKQNSEEITWEDVEAVCKLIGLEVVRDPDGGLMVETGPERLMYSYFDDPKEALEFITAEKPVVQ